MIRFEQITKQYPDGTVAVDHLDLEVQKGEFLVLAGPSGCGKTTTLKMINRLIPTSSGSLYIDGKPAVDYPLDQLRWNIGYVLQQIALFPHMTIEENITVVPEMKGWPKEKLKARAAELLRMVGLDPDIYAARKPSELSGGQQQRVGVVRALAADPDILLMDEPFSALDPVSREKLQDDLLRLKEELGKTTVFVTHDMDEALKLADRICLMREGKVVQLSTPEDLLLNPADDFVRSFIGKRKEEPAVDLRAAMEKPDAENEPAVVLPAFVEVRILLNALAEHDSVGVESAGKIVGRVSRGAAFRLLARMAGKGGTDDGGTHG
ncbi:ABC transporter ATP-binding protein [Edaphobacillus lindanitolerans]|uniref:Quaternary amine transport ATP-binding protein n=1 Tax=Edaphobacillus lindanitolerans TaxID=550447 RepID=A0A1U7PQL0_9BACI|nr:ABC transporter ATP-binding protein [Edaphobacillus lindanitolerans]SIT84369.1 osmoprotectant transport system ATP-binding protein [Edaphobacillus lindanitolerans]